VAGWQRKGFQLFWRLKSRAKRVGRPRIALGVRELIRQMATENGWGALPIHGDPLKLGVDYVAYCHQDRCHLALCKDTPNGWGVTSKPSPTARVVALPRVGGLHHRYEWCEAA